MTETITRKTNLHSSDNSTETIEHHLSKALGEAMLKEPKDLDAGDKQAMERFLRRHIKRDAGPPRRLSLEEQRHYRSDKPAGFRKGTLPEDIKTCELILEKLGRCEVAWDETITVPGDPE